MAETIGLLLLTAGDFLATTAALGVGGTTLEASSIVAQAIGGQTIFAGLTIAGAVGSAAVLGTAEANGVNAESSEAPS